MMPAFWNRSSILIATRRKSHSIDSPRRAVFTPTEADLDARYSSTLIAVAPSESSYPQERDHCLLLRRRIGPGAGLFMRAAERVPIRERVPDLLGCRLGLRAQLGEVHARNDGALHHHLAVDDDGVDVVAHAAFHDAFDGIAHRSIAQRVASREIDDDDVGERARRKAPDIVAAERDRPAD